MAAAGARVGGDTVADAVLIETSAGPDGEGHIATFTTAASKAEMTPVYQSTIGSCNENGRTSGGEVDTYTTVTGGLRVRVDYQDGSVTITLSPEPPPAGKKNWIRTVPGKGWFTIFRLYGPTEGYFDHSWKPTDITPTS